MRKPVRKFSLSIDGNPIFYRAGTPDKEVISDTLFREEYDVVGRDLASPSLIIDCGAYAGYSTLYFLQKYKNARIIAVEPDDENFEMCRLNLEPYKGRVTLVHGAVWSEATGLVLHRGELADGREWASMAKLPTGIETPNVNAVTLEALLLNSGLGEIDLLKMNIECSEEAVFSKNYDAWLPRVRNMIIQLHDERAEDIFFKAMSDRAFLMTRVPTLFAFTAIAPRADRKAVARTRADLAKNVLSNGDFEQLRVAPAQIIPGGWMAGSTDIALNWHVVVCDPAFHVSLAVRTGRQHSGENALLIRMNPDELVSRKTAPYAAIENTAPLPVAEGEKWEVRAFVRTCQAQDVEPRLIRGAYVFLRLRYDDGSTADLPTEPLVQATGEYVAQGGIVQIPSSPHGRTLEDATLWLYVWVVNPEPVEVASSEYGLWEVLFDDVSATKI